MASIIGKRHQVKINVVWSFIQLSSITGAINSTNSVMTLVTNHAILYKHRPEIKGSNLTMDKQTGIHNTSH